MKLYEKADKITPDRDAKLQRLKELISLKIKSPLNKGNKKVLIFTAFADTADYLYENLNTWGKNNFSIHSALISGGNKGNQSTLKFPNGSMINRYEDILVNFSPISKNRDMFITYPQEQIDLLIATDCISEGQNLQDCDYMINYDIHWNPVRIIQRFGRIDRIGSKNKDIQMVNFWPTDDLDKYIKLKNRVENRMRLVELTGAGNDSVTQEVDVDSKDEKDFRLQLLEKLKSEVLSPEDSDASFSITDFSLQDFRIDLTNFIENNRQKLKEAPLGLYSLVPPLSSNLSRIDKNLFNYKVESIIQPGVIFCLKHKHISKTNKKTLDKLNPISPYYLIYILESGDVRFNFTNSKQILDLYNLLCKGESKIYESLCDIFNKEVVVPDYLNTYTELLKKSCNIIMDKTKSLNAQDLTKNRNAQVLNQNVISNYLNDFELITWLIIKEN